MWLSELHPLVADYLPIAIAVPAVVVVVGLVQRWLDRRHSAASGHRFRDQLIVAGVVVAGVLVVILNLPVEADTRSNLVNFLGLLLTAAIALSSTTFLGNVLAGLMLRSVRSYRVGDFIRCGEHFGRVSERGMFHTEIQTEDRDLTTLPNLYLVQNPMTVVRSSGTIVSATVSLGYDVARSRVKSLLVAAAEAAGLEEPFVQVRELGDFSVVYRVAGLLTDVKTTISAGSRLRAFMLDHLHQGGVEIVSPTFMNTRALPLGRRFVPAGSEAGAAGDEDDEGAESVAFDKAEAAAALEDTRAALAEIEAELAGLAERLKGAPSEEHPSLEGRVAALKRRAATLTQLIELQQERLAKRD